MDQVELQDFLAQRRDMYDLLRRIFIGGPSRAIIRDLRSLLAYQPDDQTEELSIAGDQLIAESLSEESNDEILSDHLMREFNRLFVGPGRVVATPYESVYRSPSHLLMQENTLDVRRVYLETGLVMQRLHSVPDDHLGAQLEFMYYLADRSVEAVSRSEWEEFRHHVHTQRAFLRDHLLTWIGEFAQRVLDGSEDKFFRGLAMTLRDFVQDDAETLNELVSKFNYFETTEGVRGA